MPRVRSGPARRRKHKRVLKSARGFRGAASRRYHVALNKTFRAGVFLAGDDKRFVALSFAYAVNSWMD